MKKETLEMLMLPELCDLLVENTLLLLDSIEKKADGITIRDLKKKVEVIQEIIQEKTKGTGGLILLVYSWNSLFQHHKVREHNGSYRF